MDRCEQTDRIALYHDGELSAGEVEAVSSHLSQCGACRAELARLESISEWFSAAPQVSQAAMERLRRGMPCVQDRRVLRTASVLTAVAAAVLAVCAVFAWQGRGRASAGPVAAWEQAAVGQHPDAGAARGVDEDDADLRLVRTILGPDLATGEADR